MQNLRKRLSRLRKRLNYIYFKLRSKGRRALELVIFKIRYSRFYKSGVPGFYVFFLIGLAAKEFGLIEYAASLISECAALDPKPPSDSGSVNSEVDGGVVKKPYESGCKRVMLMLAKALFLGGLSGLA